MEFYNTYSTIITNEENLDELNPATMRFYIDEAIKGIEKASLSIKLVPYKRVTNTFTTSEPKHTCGIPDNFSFHVHDINYGHYGSCIFEPSSCNIKLYVNDILVDEKNSDEDLISVDISKYLKQGWNEIKYESSSMGRVASSLYLRTVE